MCKHRAVSKAMSTPHPLATMPLDAYCAEAFGCAPEAIARGPAALAVVSSAFRRKTRDSHRGWTGDANVVAARSGGGTRGSHRHQPGGGEVHPGTAVIRGPRHRGHASGPHRLAPRLGTPPREEWMQVQQTALRQQRRIVDGNHGATLDLRLAAADTIIFLDYPRWLCLRRALRRMLLYRGRPRPDMAEGCVQRLNLAFLRFIWGFPRTHRPRILDHLAGLGPEKQVRCLRRSCEAEAFLRQVRRLPPPPCLCQEWESDRPHRTQRTQSVSRHPRGPQS